MMPSQENNNIQGRIEAELIRMLYGNAMVVIIGSGATAFILLILMWKVVPMGLSISWIIALLILYIIRLYWIREVTSKKPDDDKTAVWEKRFVIGALISGLLWGSAGILIFIYGPDDYYRTAMLILCGLAAASMITHAPVLRSYYSFIFPTIVPITIAPFIKWNFFDALLGILAFIFMTAMIVLAGQINTVLRNELRLRFMNEELADSLRESEEKYRIVSEFTYDWEYWQAPDRSYKYMSPSCEQFTGYSPQEFIDNPSLYMSIVYPDDLPMVLEHSADFEKDDYENIDFRIIHKNGITKWISHSCRSIHDEKGAFLGRRVSNRDITDRKKAEEEVQKTSAEFSDLYNNAPCGYHSLDKDGVIIGINDTELMWLGYTREEMAGKMKIIDIMTPESLKVFQSNFPVFKEQGHIEDLEFNFKRKNGTTFPVLLNATAIKDSDGNYLSSRTTIFDITERKKAEEARRESENRFSTLVQSMDNIVYTLDTNEKHTGIYGKSFGELGLSANFFIGKSAIDIFGEGNGKVHHEANLKALAGKYVTYEWSTEQDGKALYYLTSLSPMLDTDGKVTGIVGIGQDITERRHNEEIIKHLNADFLATLAAIPDLLFELTKEGTYINIWAHSPELLAQQKELLMGNNISKVLSSEAARTVQESIDEADNKGYSYGKVIMIEFPGTTKWFELSTSKKVISKDTQESFIMLSRDITERKRIEYALKESEARFRSAMEYAPIGMALVSLEGKFINVNAALCDITGYAEDELKNLTFQEITYPDDLEIDLASAQKLIAGEIPSYSMEKRYVRKNGSIVWIQLTGSLLKDDDDKPLYFIAQIENINERKQAEEKLKQSESNLAKAQMIAHIGHWDWNIITNELYWSDEIYRIFGLTPHQFEATYDAFLDTIHTDDKDIVINAVNDAVNNNKPYNIEHRIVHPDGSIRIVNEQGEVTRNERGKAIRMIGTVQDITERNEYEEKLKEANASKDKFFSIIAHDLKNPFNALLGSAEALHENIDDFDKDDLRDMSNIIYRSSKNAYALLENLLEWSRSQLDRLDIKLHDINLRDIVHESIMIVESQAENKQIIILNTISDTTVYADTNLLKTVLRNLLSNAIKYTNAGGNITVNSKQNNDMVEVSVSDTGVGMPPEVMEKIFKIDTKHSTPGTAKETGTGLGLVLCREFVERQGGRIWVESEVGKGTKFTFTLPIAGHRVNPKQR